MSQIFHEKNKELTVVNEDIFKSNACSIFCDCVLVMFLRLSDNSSHFQLNFVQKLKTVNKYHTKENFLHSDSNNDGRIATAFMIC